MKLPLPLLLAAAVLLALWGGMAQQSHIHNLGTEISRLEVAADSAANPLTNSTGESARPLRTRRATREDASKLADEVIDFTKEFDARSSDKSPHTPAEDATFRQHLFNLLSRLAGLGSDDMLAFISATRERMDPADKLRGATLSICGRLLAAPDPRAALRLAETTTGDEQKDLRHAALKSIARTNPTEAFAEFDRLSAIEPDSFKDSMLKELIVTSASANPTLAMSRLFALPDAALTSAANEIGAAAKSNSERDALIAQFAISSARDSAPAHAANATGFFQGIGASLATTPFQETEAWLAAKPLSAEDQRCIAAGAARTIHNADQAAAWTSWAASHLTPNAVSEPLQTWANLDSQAALQWIEGQAQGPARSQAEATYLDRLARHDPEAAKALAARFNHP